MFLFKIKNNVNLTLLFEHLLNFFLNVNIGNFYMHSGVYSVSKFAIINSANSFWLECKNSIINVILLFLNDALYGVLRNCYL